MPDDAAIRVHLAMALIASGSDVNEAVRLNWPRKLPASFPATPKSSPRSPGPSSTWGESMMPCGRSGPVLRLKLEPDVAYFLACILNSVKVAGRRAQAARRHLEEQGSLRPSPRCRCLLSQIKS